MALPDVTSNGSECGYPPEIPDGISFKISFIFRVSPFRKFIRHHWLDYRRQSDGRCLWVRGERFLGVTIVTRFMLPRSFFSTNGRF